MKIYMKCFGCTANFGESNELMAKLTRAGHSVVENISNAHIVIIRTCCVIKRTELNMKKEIDNIRKFSLPVLITGCMASREELFTDEEKKGVHILPINQEENILQLIDDIEQKGLDSPDERSTHENKNKPLTTLVKSNCISPNSHLLATNQIVVISNGCLGNCTYCITRLARGKLESYNEKSIRNSVTKALQDGKREIFITSQDNAVWGMDPGLSSGGKTGNKLLPWLLGKILSDNQKYKFRMRVGMMNPWGLERIIDQLLKIMEDPNIYSFLHLPLQSGSNRVLENMGRRYNAETFSLMVKKTRTEIPDITISTDVIVGFPGETDEDFSRTIKVIRNIRPEIINITRFSGRPGTRAMDMKEQVVGRVAKDRSRILTKLHREIINEFLEKYVGKKLNALAVESGINHSTILRTDSNIPIIVKDILPLGKFFTVDIIGKRHTYLIGRPS